jgi:NAD(P)-dependent dehydrogenase (short-subunit alcohol dehydrogenase family)
LENLFDLTDKYAIVTGAGRGFGRNATADELVGTAMYFASGASTYITGHSLIIDSGWIAGL